jgi:hypothetical protein
MEPGAEVEEIMDKDGTPKTPETTQEAAIAGAQV